MLCFNVVMLVDCMGICLMIGGMCRMFFLVNIYLGLFSSKKEVVNKVEEKNIGNNLIKNERFFFKNLRKYNKMGFFVILII